MNCCDAGHKKGQSGEAPAGGGGKNCEAGLRGYLARHSLAAASSEDVLAIRKTCDREHSIGNDLCAKVSPMAD
jgi:hypothetical protein